MTNQEIEKERQAFEAWQKSSRNEDRLYYEYSDEYGAGGIFYEDISMDYAWQGWFAAKQQSGWISVADRLPENGTECLVWKESATGNYGSCGYIFSTFENGRFDDIYAHEKVTHWQPLPAPPKD